MPTGTKVAAAEGRLDALVKSYSELRTVMEKHRQDVGETLLAVNKVFATQRTYAWDDMLGLEGRLKEGMKEKLGGSEIGTLKLNAATAYTHSIYNISKTAEAAIKLSGEFLEGVSGWALLMSKDEKVQLAHVYSAASEPRAWAELGKAINNRPGFFLDEVNVNEVLHAIEKVKIAVRGENVVHNATEDVIVRKWAASLPKVYENGRLL